MAHLSEWKPKLSRASLPEGPQAGVVISLMAIACMFHVKGDSQ